MKLNSKASAPKPFFRASVSADALELLIYEDIGVNWWDGEGITAKTIKQQIDKAGRHSKILVRINSPGGDAFEGMAIFNLLRAQGKPIEVCVDGIAASSASIIAMAGSTITMGTNAMMMIHNAWSVCMGDAEDMLKTADTLQKISLSIGKTYSDRTGKSAGEIKGLMDAETWMSADECVENGFATRIAESPDEDQAIAMARGFKTLSLMRRVPANLKNAAACDCDCPACTADDCGNCSNADCDDANCEDCPMQQDTTADASNLSLYEARLKLLRL